MEETENGRKSLIASIEKDAQAEADTILADAQKLADEQKAYGEKQAGMILKKAQKQAAQQSEAVKKKILAGIDIEVKRKVMRAQDSLLNMVLDRVEEQLHALVRDKHYRDILLNWVVEAAIGLNTDAAVISASGDELAFINKTFLAEAEKKVKSYTGRRVALSLSTTPQNRLQGINLTAKDGRTAFNNQVRTRIARRQREIRKRIYDMLFGKEEKG
jgi:vacuolar-type H+-ATPase subunit E/Vma4